MGTPAPAAAETLRRGSLYIPVLGCALIVSAIGMSAMVSSRLSLRMASARTDLAEARRLADSAVELGVAAIQQDTEWRSNYEHDVKYPASPLALGRGTLTWRFFDPDGNLADDVTDAVRLFGQGKAGTAVYTSSVLLQPSSAGLSCLEASLHSNGQFWMWSGVTVTTDQFISTNNAIYTNGSGVINGDAEAVGTIQNGSVSGSTTTGILPRVMPNKGHVFNYYLNNGTWIDVNDLPSESIEKVVLSPDNNPFGTGGGNAQGIYVIDCQGADLLIKDARLEATLVLLNAGSGTKLDGNISWGPAVRNFPALLVDGNLLTQWTGGTALSESNAGVNFNPTGAPYQGEEDADTSDAYPGVIQGIVYVSGYLDVQNPCHVNGVVVCNTINPQANMNLTYDPVFLSSPPPGFRGGSAASSPEQQWIDQNSSNSGDGGSYTLADSVGVGTFFAPVLPAEATSWSVTRVQFYCNDAGSTGVFEARVTKADGDRKPSTVLDSVTVQETTLPGTFDWHEVAFGSAGGLQPTEAACVVVVAVSNAGARLQFGSNSNGSPDTHFLTSGDGGASWSVNIAEDLWIRIWGKYATASGSVVEISPGSWRREASN